MKATLLIENRDYSKWSFIPNDVIPPDEFTPSKSKLFHGDVLEFNNNIFNVVSSIVKDNEKHPGVLILNDNKSYGKTKNDRHLYKCVPYNKNMPVFLIPYDIKISFNKIQKNKYILFKFNTWNDKHPIGLITETLGDVDNLEVFYEYQLYCRELQLSMSEFNKKARLAIRENNVEKIKEEMHHFHLEDKTDINVFTIDNLGSKDYDDGFSVEENKDGTVKICIYIANVYFWIDKYALWDYINTRVATIYLPDKKRPMLPFILSDNICSLNKNTYNVALSMEIYLKNENIIREPIYKNVIIKVSNNYCYEEMELLNNDKYKKLFEITKTINNSVKTSYDVVTHWMTYMNKKTADYLSKYKTGIFREISLRETVIQEPYFYIKCWKNNNTGKYKCYTENEEPEKYVHITSPIRRVVDLLNQIMLCNSLNIVKTKVETINFLENWIKRLDYININMKSIRKIQTECELIKRCFTNINIVKEQHSGIVFDKLPHKNDTFQYTVYLEKIKLFASIKTTLDIPEYSICYFNIRLFDEENNSKRKIRVQLVEKDLIN